MEPILNTRITSLKESSTLMVNQMAKDRRASGHNVFHYGFGQSPFPVHPKIQEALAKNAHQKQYLPSLGLPALRESFCEYYEKHFGYKFSPDCVLIGPGSKELIFQAIFTLEGPLLIPAPSWVSYGPQAHMRGKHVEAIPTKKSTGYRLTAEELKDTCDRLLVNRQKILILNNPNNPTGSVYSQAEIEAISEVCRDHGVIVISDEIYNLCDFSGEEYYGFSRSYPEGTIVTNGLSKGHSAGGYRLGILAVPDNMKQVMKALVAMVSETYSAVSAPTQYAAVVPFGGDSEVMEYAAQCTRIHKVTGEYFFQRFCEMGVGCIRPQGAFYLFPDFERYLPNFRRLGVNTSPEMTRLFFEKLSVVVLPSNDFYCSPDYLACRVATVDYDGAKVYEASVKASHLDSEFVEQYCPSLKNGCDALQKFLASI